MDRLTKTVRIFLNDDHLNKNKSELHFIVLWEFMIVWDHHGNGINVLSGILFFTKDTAPIFLDFFLIIYII